MENEIPDLSFEEAFAELQLTIEELRSETLTLERSLALYERGALLAKHCGELLSAAELRVRQIGPATDQSTLHGDRFLEEEF